MTPEHADLYERIRSYRFDADGTTYTFAQRLAKENGWSREYADRVVEEYRRFALLAVAAGHSVSPSDAVDQAWHQHLVYTRAYWDEFCGKILRTPLHHEPGRGGFAERNKFGDWYARTLDSYRRFFAEAPPADVWPDPATKQKRVEHFRRVDVARHWVVRKPRLAAVVPVLMAATLALTTTLHEGDRAGIAQRATSSVAVQTLNPFDLTGPHFLVFYAVALPIGFLFAWSVRARMASNAVGPSPRRLPPLDVYQIACLGGGPAHAIHAAITSLFQREVIKVDGLGGTVEVLRPQARLDHPFEQAVKIAAMSGRGPVRVRTVRLAARREAENLREGLARLGLLVPHDRATAAAVLATAVALTVPLVGAVKICVGLSRNKPVGFLAAACVLSTVAAVAIFSRLPGRTRLGDEVLRRLRDANARLESRREAITPEGLALGVALFGLGFLEATNLRAVAKALRSPDVAATGSTWGGGLSCGTSSSGGSSCGGGGGCGGGGCGGCGGS